MYHKSASKFMIKNQGGEEEVDDIWNDEGLIANSVFFKEKETLLMLIANSYFRKYPH